METKQFHLGDVLTATTGRLVSQRHMEGVYDIRGFMTGEELWTHQLPRAGKVCEDSLKEQFPQLAGKEMELAIADLDKRLEAKTDRDEGSQIVAEWLSDQVEQFGEMFEVKPLLPGVYAAKYPVAEAVEMVGPEKVIVI